MFSDPPATAAWRHVSSRIGFEASSFGRRGRGWIASGSTTAVEAGTAWWVTYDIELSSSFVTRRARVSARTGTGRASSIVIEGDGFGSWVIDGRSAPRLDGCLDVDLESSALTNALPVRRLELAIDDGAAAPAAYVRVQPRLAIERLEQHYVRREDGGQGPSFDYQAPSFQFACRIDYDWSGLVIGYPGIAERIT